MTLRRVAAAGGRPLAADCARLSADCRSTSGPSRARGFTRRDAPGKWDEVGPVEKWPPPQQQQHQQRTRLIEKQSDVGSFQQSSLAVFNHRSLG